jgi:GDP-L-fucose synthase
MSKAMPSNNPITKSSKIFVAGHRGMVGSALVRTLEAKGYTNILTRTRDELDLLDQRAVYDFLQVEKPDYIFIAAAKVGGIHANNTYRADFIFQNLQIESNLIHGAHLAGVQRLMFLGSSCIYPRDCPQPIKEEYLLTGPLEPTNEAYAIAKIAGIKLCEAYNHQHGRQYISVMPTNLYGINDNYDLETSHVLPALIRKAHEAKMRGDKTLEVWGTGAPRREFLFADDLADACLHLMESASDSGLINVGCGEDLRVSELAQVICDVVGFNGKLKFSTDKPDGTPRKLLSIDLLKQLGWSPRIDIREGVALSYRDMLVRTPQLSPISS